MAPGTSILEERTGGTAIAIRADFVTVEGFVITGVTWPKPYGTEEHNDLIGNAGIRVYSDFNKIVNNTFTGNDLTAIGLWNCTNNQIIGNTIKDVSFGYGIQFYNSSMNTIEKMSSTTTAGELSFSAAIQIPSIKMKFRRAPTMESGCKLQFHHLYRVHHIEKRP